ncbi:phosphoserine phosphatase SerB [Leptospira sp. 96542]|nr:phosphoserine phosphatase SerB [Leptospira sp. 96542]
MSFCIFLANEPIQIENLGGFDFFYKLESNFTISGLFVIRLQTEENLSRETILSIRKRLIPQKIDFIFIPNLLSSREPSLFVFDMDSTVIQEEVIDELARKHGVFDSVADVTKQAMNGGLGFEDSLKLRVANLKGLSIQSFEEVYQSLNLNPGMDFVFENLPKLGAKIGILSGGFTPILKLFAEKYPVDFYKANGLEVLEGFFTGVISGEIIGKEKKAYYFETYRNQYRIPKNHTVAIGDGANDALMLQTAGIGIGFHAKQGLKDNITNWIDFVDMRALLTFFG